jgi:hypothetical protein
VLVTSLVLLVLTGCGGGESETVAILTSLGAFDGFVTNTAVVDTNGAGAITVGDTDATLAHVARGFVRFDRSAVPAGATILYATFQIHQAAVTGTPFATHGNLLLEHLSVGPSLDAADFGAAAVTVGALSATPNLGYRTLDVTAAVLADIAALRTTSDFRLAFALGSDADGADDHVQFNDAEDHLGSGVRPTLFVAYTP